MIAARSAAVAAAGATRNTLRTTTRRFATTITQNAAKATVQIPLRISYRPFSNSRLTAKGLSPESSDPKPPNTESHEGGQEAADISDAEYHEIADQYMNTLVLALEELADGEKGSEGVEVEYSVSFPLYPCSQTVQTRY